MPAKNLQRVAEGKTYCHVYNSGVENRNIFADDVDYQVFLGYLEDYLSEPKNSEITKKEFTINGRVYKGVPHQPKNYFNKVELLAYSLKPDHFHLILHQKTQKSLQGFIRSLCTRYSMYFNKKYNRTGSLFAGPYKSAAIKDDSGLLLLTRHLHKEDGVSSYPEYSGQNPSPWVKTNVVLSAKISGKNYKDFVEKYEPNKKELELLKDIAIENLNQHLERRNPVKMDTRPRFRIPEFLGACAIFILLLGFGIRNIQISQATSTTLGESTVSTTPSPAAKSEPKIVLAVTTTEPVSIREQPTGDSKVIAKADYGDQLTLVSENSNWYQVILPDGTLGFISSEFVEKQTETNND